MFNLNQKWCFPPNNYGQIWGISDSGIETFLGTPLKSLAREICQNSLDARIDNGKPTRIEFSVFKIKPAEIPDSSTLIDAFKRSLDFWGKQESEKARSFFKEALHTIQKPAITCLRISDFNTIGLEGARDEYNSPWCDLIKSSGSSDKAAGDGGSFGIGKYAPFACSSLRTIIYNTSSKKDNLCAHQGVSRLTSFKNKNGEITQGTGFYGNDKNSPVLTQISLDPNFSRKEQEYGTDIFVLGFKGEEGWQDQMIASVLDGFLYAIYNHDLVVYIDGIEISKNTLPDLMISHKPYFKDHADEYYQVLTNESVARVFIQEYSNDPEIVGTLTLKLMIMPEFHRTVAMVRKTGMKIYDKKNISGLIPFSGILFIDGEKINDFLRNLENPQHIAWEPDRAKNQATKNKAKRLLSYLTKFIKLSLEEMKNDDSEEELDPSVGEYLSAALEEDVANQEKTESIQNTIESIKIRGSRVTPQAADPLATNDDDTAQTAEENFDGDIEISDLPGEGGSGSVAQEGGGGEGGGDNSGDGGGDVPTNKQKTPSTIAPINVRSMVRNKMSGEYTIFFTPKASATEGFVKVFMSAESQNYEAPVLSAYCDECPDIWVDNNQIYGLTFTESKQLKINIQLNYHDYCSLEVKAYGNKI